MKGFMTQATKLDTAKQLIGLHDQAISKINDVLKIKGIFEAEILNMRHNDAYTEDDIREAEAHLNNITATIKFITAPE